MLKKLLLFALVALSSISTTHASPAEFFKVEEEPESPGLLKMVAIYWFMTPQNRLWRRQLIQIAPRLLIDPFISFGSRKTATKALSVPSILLVSFLSNFLRRTAEDGASLQTALKSLYDIPFSLNITEEKPWAQALNSLKFIWIAKQINQLVFDIEMECADLEIKSGLKQAYFPPDNNYFVLPTELYLSSQIAEILCKQAGAATEYKSLSGAGYFAQVLKYYKALNHHIIPHETILKLSPELQERCYDLSHKIAALSINQQVASPASLKTSAIQINNLGRRLRCRFKTIASMEGPTTMIKKLAFSALVEQNSKPSDDTLANLNTSYELMLTEQANIEIALDDGETEESVAQRRANLATMKQLFTRVKSINMHEIYPLLEFARYYSENSSFVPQENSAYSIVLKAK